MQSAILDNLQHRTRAIQAALQQKLDVAIAEICSMADSDSAQSGDWAQLYAHAKRILGRHPILKDVSLVETSSMHLVFRTDQAMGSHLPDVRAVESIQQVLLTGRPHVSQAFQLKEGGDMMVAVTVPLARPGDGGKTFYVLRALMLTDVFNEVLRSAQMPKGWVAALVDSSNVFVARSLSPQTFVGKPGSKSFYEGMKLTDGQPYACVTVEGTPCTCSVLPVNGGDWFVGVGVPNTVLNQALTQSQRQLAYLALFGLLLAFGVAYFCTRFLLRQVTGLLTEITSPLAEGTALSTAGLRIPELQRLSEEFRFAKRRELDAHSNLVLTRLERDEVTDLYERAPCGYHSLDEQGRVVRINQTLLEWLGHSREKVLGRSVNEFLTPDSRKKFTENFPKFLKAGHIENLELELCCADGRVLPVLLSATALYDEAGRFLASRTTTFDLSERKRWEAQLQALARTDELTGLSNRRDFYEKANLEIQRCQRHPQPLAVLTWDIDHFKKVNDDHGHRTGDQILHDIAQACRSQLRAIDGIGRLGGEEFGAYLPDTSLEAAMAVAERIRTKVEHLKSLTADGQNCEVTLSVGVAMWRPEDKTIDTVLARADGALYQAKDAGRNQVISRA